MLEKGAWWVERGWVLRYLTGRTVTNAKKTKKRIGPSAQRQLMTYPRQLFVVLEGPFWKPSRTHLDKNLGSKILIKQLGSATLGEFLPCAGKTQEKKHQPDGSRTWCCAFLQRCCSSREARNHWRSAGGKVLDCSHSDVSTPKPRVAGCAPKATFCMSHSLGSEVTLLRV